MQKCFLVVNKTTQVKEYLEHRSIVEVTEEHKSLSEIDLSRLGIIDVDKFVYMHYESDDNDMSIRTDLNVFRQLLSSAFFHTREAIFILVDCKNPMLEDLIHSACKDSELIGDRLSIFHHSGTLTLRDAGTYITGDTFATDTVTSSYRTVYIREEDKTERERYADSAGELDSILPLLTDQYAMYKRRANVEAASAGTIVSDPYSRPATRDDFVEIVNPNSRRWVSFLISGEQYTLFQNSVICLLDYFGRIGYRTLVVDLTVNGLCDINSASKRITLQELQSSNSFPDKSGLVQCRFNQLGFVIEMLPNIMGVHRYIFVCDKEDYKELSEFLSPLNERFYTNFVTHFSEESVRNYLLSGIKSTTVFLSSAITQSEFDISMYREQFSGQRVALFDHQCSDSTEFYECAIGGVLD